MFDPRSRYRDIADASFTLEDGRVVAYRLRRFLPPMEDLHLAGTVFAEPNERIDHLASRIMGDPQQYWQLCDANAVLDPQA
ncbi:MAG: hypothetical protein HN348_24565, partial [Proteobacteria bacterium]|nr:hypothetical protein [Pseudomonadota bacterium]